MLRLCILTTSKTALRSCGTPKGFPLAESRGEENPRGGVRSVQRHVIRYSRKYRKR